MPINRWIDKQVVICSCNGILLHNKSETITGTYNNMAESQKHAEKKKSGTQELPY